MRKNIITISDNGVVTVPANVQMRDFEIAGLFGVMLPAVRSNIRTILKTGVVTEDTINGATLVGRNILPDYFGLDMVAALAFRMQSHRAEVFREWVIRKMATVERQQVILQYNYQVIATHKPN